MSNFAKCPYGHSLPFKGLEGNCTPLRCGNGDASKPGRREGSPVKRALDDPKSKSALRADKSLPPDEAGAFLQSDKGQAYALAKVEESEDKKIKVASVAREKWLAFLGTPKGLTGDEAEKYADGKLATLLVDAVAEVERNLKFGSPEQRERAANKVLDANGRGRREAIAASAPPIVINIQGGGSLPWRQEKVVEGEAMPPAKLPAK